MTRAHVDPDSARSHWHRYAMPAFIAAAPLACDVPLPRQLRPRGAAIINGGHTSRTLVLAADERLVCSRQTAPAAQVKGRTSHAACPQVPDPVPSLPVGMIAGTMVAVASAGMDHHVQHQGMAGTAVNGAILRTASSTH
jgi:hypothetical protein